MAEQQIITKAIDVITMLRNNIVAIKFIKKTTNETRIMKCTLNFKLIPDDKKPQTIDLPKILKYINTHKMIHVFDVEKEEWRTIPLLSGEWLQVGNIQYKLDLKE